MDLLFKKIIVVLLFNNGHMKDGLAVFFFLKAYFLESLSFANHYYKAYIINFYRLFSLNEKDNRYNKLKIV